MPKVEHVRDKDGVLLAQVFRKDHPNKGGPEPGSTEFFTTPNCPLQVGYLCKSRGTVIAPHTHPARKRMATQLMEALVVTKGRLIVYLYGDKATPQEERTLIAGEVIVLYSGGHAFEVTHDCEMWEFKNGPHWQATDKVPLVEVSDQESKSV